MLVYPTYPTFPTFGEDSWQKETLVHLNRTGVSLTRAQIATIDANIRAIRFGSTATLSALTCKLSTVAGTAFITSPSVDLRPYLDFKITLNDGTQNLVGWIKAAGTGETYTDNLNGWDFTSGWSATNAAITDSNTFTTSVNNGYVKKDVDPITIGAVYKWVLDASTTSGSVVMITGTFLETIAGQGTTYTTAVRARFGVKNTLTGATIDVSTLQANKVLTPSATGVTIVSAAGGTTYNWTSDGGINPNVESFTATITKE